MKRKSLVFTLILLALSAMAQAAGRQFVIPVSADGKATLTCFLPSTDKATGRAIVICPGGAYWIVAMQHEGTDWGEYFCKQGIASFVLNYRMPHGDRSLPISDAMNAMKMVRDSAQAWNVNPYDVGIMGSSAGGHLASTVCTHADFAHRPNFAILFYPVISMDERMGHAGSAKNLLGREWHDAQLVAEYSNQLHVARHITPPTLLLLTNDDDVVPPVTNAVLTIPPCGARATVAPCTFIPLEATASVSEPPLSITTRCLPTSTHGWGSCQPLAAMPCVWPVSATVSLTVQA